MTTREQAAAQEAQWILSKVAEADPVIRSALDAMVGRSARSRYFTANGIGIARLFERRGNRLFCYTTERVQGKYLSYDLVNQRKGGPAKPRAIARHTTRKAAKERARQRARKEAQP